jgi:hypothetical protein
MAGRVRYLQKNGAIQKAMIGGMMDVGFVAGCGVDQTSADTNEGGKPCGALSYYFQKNLQQMQDSQLSDVVAATVKDLVANSYDQTPLADGTRAVKPFLKS